MDAPNRKRKAGNPPEPPAERGKVDSSLAPTGLNRRSTSPLARRHNARDGRTTRTGLPMAFLKNIGEDMQFDVRKNNKEAAERRARLQEKTLGLMQERAPETPRTRMPGRQSGNFSASRFRGRREPREEGRLRFEDDRFVAYQEFDECAEKYDDRFDRGVHAKKAYERRSDEMHEGEAVSVAGQYHPHPAALHHERNEKPQNPRLSRAQAAKQQSPTSVLASQPKYASRRIKYIPYSNDCVPILYSDKIAHNTSAKLPYTPTKETFIRALEVITRGFTARDLGFTTCGDVSLGRSTQNRKGLARIIDDVDLFVHQKDIYVACERGLVNVPDYLSLIGVPSTQKVRFDGHNPPWAKDTLAKAEKRRVSQAHHPTEPNELRLRRMNVVEVYEIHKGTWNSWSGHIRMWAIGKLIDGDRVGWFPLDVTEPMIERRWLMPMKHKWTAKDAKTNADLAFQQALKYERVSLDWPTTGVAEDSSKDTSHGDGNGVEKRNTQEAQDTMAGTAPEAAVNKKPIEQALENPAKHTIGAPTEHTVDELTVNTADNLKEHVVDETADSAVVKATAEKAHEDTADNKSDIATPATTPTTAEVQTDKPEAPSTPVASAEPDADIDDSLETNGDVVEDSAETNNDVAYDKATTNSSISDHASATTGLQDPKPSNVAAPKPAPVPAVYVEPPEDEIDWGDEEL